MGRQRRKSREQEWKQPLDKERTNLVQESLRRFVCERNPNISFLFYQNLRYFFRRQSSLTVTNWKTDQNTFTIGPGAVNDDLAPNPSKGTQNASKLNPIGFLVILKLLLVSSSRIRDLKTRASVCFLLKRKNDQIWSKSVTRMKKTILINSIAIVTEVVELCYRQYRKKTIRKRIFDPFCSVFHHIRPLQARKQKLDFWGDLDRSRKM